MFWDGSNWVDETPKPTPSPIQPKRRARDWAATGLMGIIFVGLIIPSIGVFASSSGSSGSVASWYTDFRVTDYQENSSNADYNGRWTRILNQKYSHGHARSTDQAGAGVTFRFRGTAVAVIYVAAISRAMRSSACSKSWRSE